MLKKLYIKAVTHILCFLNYNKFENSDGANHVILNGADLVLAFVYALVSVWKLSSVTNYVLAVNLLTLVRLMLGNLKKSISLRDKYEEKYLKRPGLSFKSAYDIKLIIEFCVIAFSLVPFCFQGALLEEHTIRSFAGIIIALGFMENLINIFIELFKASQDM